MQAWMMQTRPRRPKKAPSVDQRVYRHLQDYRELATDKLVKDLLIDQEAVEEALQRLCQEGSVRLASRAEEPARWAACHPGEAMD